MSLASSSTSLGDLGPRINIRTKVAEALRAALIAGELKPGSVYSAPALAERFGVSATPVREAMLDLVREGMVEVMPNTGFKVTEVSDRELDNLVELRLLIEVPTMGAVAEACQGRMVHEVKALQPLADRLRESAESGDLIGYLRADTEFHVKFLSLSGNSKLVDVVRSLRSMSRLYGLERLAAEGRLASSSAEHDQMIQLALAQDKAGMMELVEHHIRHTRSQDQTGKI